MGTMALATTGDGLQQRQDAEAKIGILLQAFQAALIESDKRKDEKLPWTLTSAGSASSPTWATDLLPADYDQWEAQNKKYAKERDALNKFVEDFPKQIKDLCDKAGRVPDDVVASIERTLKADVAARKQATDDAERRLWRFDQLVTDVFGPKKPDPVKVLERQVADAIAELRDGVDFRLSELSAATIDNGARIELMKLGLSEAFERISNSLAELREAIADLSPPGGGPAGSPPAASADAASSATSHDAGAPTNTEPRSSSRTKR